MDKNVMKKLIEWKNSKNIVPLILRGKKSINKIDIIQQFGNENYDEIAYFDFSNNAELKNLFNTEKDVLKILKHLSVMFGKSILPKTILIVFNNIQECPNVLNLLKDFNEKADEYHIICTGFSLGILLASRSFAPCNVKIIDILA